jgi:hypothetical protein
MSMNRTVAYTLGASVDSKVEIRQALVDQDIYVTRSDSFRTRFLNVFHKYILPNVNTEATVNAWRTNSMIFWQNQVTFAVW